MDVGKFRSGYIAIILVENKLPWKVIQQQGTSNEKEGGRQRGFEL